MLQFYRESVTCPIININFIYIKHKRLDFKSKPPIVFYVCDLTDDLKRNLGDNGYKYSFH